MFIPRYVDRPRLIVFIEADSVAWAVGSFLLMLGLLFMTPFYAVLIIGVSAAFSAVSTAIYVKYKINAPPGLAKHIFYDLGIRHPINQKGKSSPEIERIGYTNFIPSGAAIEFWG